MNGTDQDQSIEDRLAALEGRVDELEAENDDLHDRLDDTRRELSQRTAQFNALGRAVTAYVNKRDGYGSESGDAYKWPADAEALVKELSADGATTKAHRHTVGEIEQHITDQTEKPADGHAAVIMAAANTADSSNAEVSFLTVEQIETLYGCSQRYAYDLVDEYDTEEWHGFAKVTRGGKKAVKVEVTHPHVQRLIRKIDDDHPAMDTTGVVS